MFYKKIFQAITLIILMLTIYACALNTAEKIKPQLIWSDEFDTDGLPDPSKWDYKVGGYGWGNNELQYYTRAREKNVRVKDGVLIIEAHKETYQDVWGNVSDYTSTRLISKGRGDWQYGRFEVRAKLPRGTGTWPAIWMLPSVNRYGNWPHSGEIDIMEHVGFEMGEVHGTLHFSERFGDNAVTGSMPVENVDTEFHVYTVDWLPNEITFSIDGVAYHSYKDPGKGWQHWPFDHPFYLLMNIAVGGHWGGRHGIDADIWPQRMEVDYVRVYDLGHTITLDKQRKSEDDDRSLFVNADFSEGLAGWFMRSERFSDSGEKIRDLQSWRGDIRILDHVSTEADHITFTQTDMTSDEAKIETTLFQVTRPLNENMMPGDTITFSGNARHLSSSKEGEVHAFIVRFNGDEILPNPSYKRLPPETEAFEISMTLPAESFEGLAIGFRIISENGAQDTVVFSDVAAKFMSHEN